MANGIAMPVKGVEAGWGRYSLVAEGHAANREGEI
jgi:hypothetical protein